MSKFLTALFFISIGCLSAQPYLALKEVVSNTLKSNHDIIIAQQQLAIAVNQEGLGAAGFLPTLELQGGTNQSLNDTKQRFVSGQELNRNGAKSNSLNGALALNWTLFDGGRMFTTHQKLKESSEQNRLALHRNIEETIAQVMQTYYTWVLQFQLIKAQENAILVSEERIRIANQKLETGAGNKLEVLQAQLDRNAQASGLEQLQQEKLRVQIELNRLQGISLDQSFLPSDTLPIRYVNSFDSLRTVSAFKNRNLKLLQQNITLRKLEQEEAKSSRLPVIGLTVSYGLNRVENEAGFLLFNNTRSLYGGLTASWMLYDGGSVKRQLQNTALMLRQSETQLEQMKAQTEAQLKVSWELLKQMRRQLQRESENVQLARQALEIALERFRLGSSTSLELMTVQQSAAEAEARLASSGNALNQAIINLMLLDGSLLMGE